MAVVRGHEHAQFTPNTFVTSGPGGINPRRRDTKGLRLLELRRHGAVQRGPASASISVLCFAFSTLCGPDASMEKARRAKKLAALSSVSTIRSATLSVPQFLIARLCGRGTSTPFGLTLSHGGLRPWSHLRFRAAGSLASFPAYRSQLWDARSCILLRVGFTAEWN